jgi:hypothetical protein
MAPFAKIIEIEGQQVLFWVEEDDDHEGCVKMHQMVDFDGIRADITLGGIKDPEGKATALLLDKHATEKQARYVIETIKATGVAG